MNHPNIDVYRYNPIRLKNIAHIHVVHHEKYILVDDQYTLLGGRNFGDKYFTDGPNHVNDYDVLVKGNSLNEEMRCHFTKHIKQTKQIKKMSGKGIYTPDYESKLPSIDLWSERFKKVEKIAHISNNTGIDLNKGQVYLYFEKKIRDSKATYLQSPYSTKSKQLLKNFGKNDQLLTNSITSSPNYPAFSNYWINRRYFLKTGIKINEFQSENFESLHGKGYLFDDGLLIGSMNLDHRSFNINTESMLWIESNEIEEEFLEIYKELVKQSVIFQKDMVDNKNNLINPPFYKIMLMYLMSIFSRIFDFLI